MDKREYSDRQITALMKGLLKAIIVWPSCLLAELGIGTKFWKNAQFVRANNALMDMWNCYTDFGNKPGDDIQEDDWNMIERLEKTITSLSHASQNMNYEVFTFEKE